ncbi:MAG: glycosyltransferase family 8 protein [Clostridium sp.]|uniref:glycosyltransferase family 8 protein n=1 Tax=Clostridium sp. TaxID=1506 RepID=UPI00399996C3
MSLVVVYSTDDNYAQHTGVSIISLLENNKHFNSIKIYVIENRISNSNKVKLKKISDEYNRDIIFIDFNAYKNKLELNMQWNISISAYARLFISSILPNDIDKVLYFDCDTVIVNKVDELVSCDIKDYYVAGVADTISNNMKSKVGIAKEGNYINSGMLLINLNKWRKDAIENKFIEFIENKNGSVAHHDQGVINGVLHSKLKILSPKFNLMTVYYTMKREDIISYYGIDNEFYSEREINDALKNPVYIHYTPGFTTRPWVKGCKHPKKDIYIKYLKISPWNDVKLKRNNQNIKVKFVNFLYNNLPLSIANNLCNTLMKMKLGDIK